MGRSNGLISPTIRGKVGSVVFSKLGTQNIVRAYQPIVTNPRTTQQLINRAKFSAAVRLSKTINLYLNKNYGVDNLGSFGAIMKTVRNQGKIVMYKSFRDINIPVKSYFNLIGQNVVKESINPLNLENAKDNINSSGIGILLGALTEADDVTPTGDVYFGSDYAFESLGVLIATLDGNINQYSIPLTVDSVIRQPDEGGIKIQGFQASATNCGNGWKYIYKMTSANRQITLFEGAIINGRYPEDLETINNNTLNENYYIYASGSVGNYTIVASATVFIFGSNPNANTPYSTNSILISSGNFNLNVGTISPVTP